MSALLNKMESTSFLKKLSTSLLALAMAAIVLVSGVLIGSYYQSTQTLVERFFQNLLLQSNYSITYINDLAEKLSSTLSYKQEVIAFLNMEERDNLQAVITHREVRSTILPLTYVDSVYLYNGHLDLILDTKTGSQSTLADFYDESVAQKLMNADERNPSYFTPYVHDSSYNGKSTSIYSYFIAEYDDEGTLDTACVINIRMDVLTQSLQEINANNAQVKFIIADTDGSFLCTPQFDDHSVSADLQEYVTEVAASGKDAGSQNINIAGKKYLIAYTNANSNGWYLYATIPFAFIFRDVITNTVLCLLFLFLFAAACSFVAIRLARRLNRPVEIVTQIAKGEYTGEAAQGTLVDKDFKYLASTLTQMQKEKDEHSHYIQKTNRLVRQEFMKNLFTGMVVYPPTQIQAKLNEFKCTWLLDSPLRMCLFSIDNYTSFSQANNQRERWALRFAVINVATELLQRNFDCEMVQFGPNKFIAVLNCTAEEGVDKSVSALENTLSEVLSFIHTNLGFTLTAAYGPVFREVSHLPRMYENTEELLTLRIRHGISRIITPHMAEDVNLSEFHVPSAVENTLVSSVVSGKADQAVAQFETIAKDLFHYDYNEILPYLTHLAYRLYNSTKEANASVKVQATEEFTGITAQLPLCETRNAFCDHFIAYIRSLCDILNTQKNAPDAQSSNVIIQKVIKIIESNYTQKELCLSSIADELGLSAHYIGQVFRATQNRSVAKYIMDLRLEKIAQALRETNRSFAEIMEDVGLDPEQKNYIYTCFKKRFGVTVKNYRIQFNSAESK